MYVSDCEDKPRIQDNPEKKMFSERIDENDTSEEK